MATADAVSRREFLQAGTVAATAAALNPVHGATGDAPKVARIGIVGVGGRGTGLLRTMLTLPGVAVPAVCDIVEGHATRSQDMVEKATGSRPQAYTKGAHDWENLVQRDDLDAVVTATPWELHAPIMVAAMRAGKLGGTEVPAAMTLEECWDLVRTSEATGKWCMMLENVCYFRNALSLLRMVREGVFGDLLHAEAGYQHDCRYLMFKGDGTLTWR